MGKVNKSRRVTMSLYACDSREHKQMKDETSVGVVLEIGVCQNNNTEATAPEQRVDNKTIKQAKGRESCCETRHNNLVFK